MPLLILTGASGAGKTTIVQRIAATQPDIRCFFFDSIGVPPPEEMAAQYGSGEEWQRRKTIEWIEKLKPLAETSNVLFEGQTRIAFIREALSKAHLTKAKIVLVDCDEISRRARLRERKQPELANEQMADWASYLRTEAEAGGIAVLDTSNRSLEESALALLELWPESS